MIRHINSMLFCFLIFSTYFSSCCWVDVRNWSPLKSVWCMFAWSCMWSLEAKKACPKPYCFPQKLHGKYFHHLSSCIVLSLLYSSALSSHNPNIFDLLTSRCSDTFLALFAENRPASFYFVPHKALHQTKTCIKLFFFVKAKAFSLFILSVNLTALNTFSVHLLSAAFSLFLKHLCLPQKEQL